MVYTHFHKFRTHGGREIIGYFKRPYIQVISSVYNGNMSSIYLLSHEEFTWYPWKFERAGQNFWKDVRNQKLYLKWFMDELNITKDEDWYKITLEDFLHRSGMPLLFKFGSSVYNMLKAFYPEKTFHAWLFEKAPQGFWSKDENVASFVKWAETQLGITKPEDWYQITRVHLLKIGGSTATARDGIYKFLKRAYPDFEWNKKLLESKVSNKSQKFLYFTVSIMFPDMEIKERFKHPQMKFSSTGLNMELDVFIPNLSLAFEYQGEQHYMDGTFWGESKAVRQKDGEKRELCANFGITLIEVPFWWDKTKDSLRATVHQHRKDIFSDPGPGQPIPSVPPPNSLSQSKMARFQQGKDTNTLANDN